MTCAETQRLCTWSGLVGLILFFIGLIFAKFIPPLSPSLTQEEVAVLYQQNTNGIRIGMVLVLISGMFIAPFVAVISAQIGRMKGTTPLLTYAQLSSGTVNILFFVLPAVCFLITAYRPYRPMELTYLMNDLSWFVMVLPWPPFFIQVIVIAVAIFEDRSSQPIFPRWAGFFQFWAALLSVPASLLPYFKSGPFAWNGIFTFWLPSLVVGSWYIVMTTTLLKAIKRQEQEDRLSVNTASSQN